MKYYGTIGWLEDKQKFLAVISLGHPKKTKLKRVEDIELFDTFSVAETWVDEQLTKFNTAQAAIKVMVGGE